MIWHFLEVWAILLVVFVFGCLIGAFINMVIASTPLAPAQDTLIGGLSGLIAGVRARLGLGPSWRRVASPATAGYGGGPVHAVPHDQSLEPPEGERFLAPLPPPDHYPDDADELQAADEFTEAEQLPDHSEFAQESLNSTEPTVREPSSSPTRPLQPIPDPAPPPRPALPLMRPVGLPEPRNGVPDNLQRIRGIGKKNEELLNSLGIFHFGQIAAWTPSEVRWIASQIAFPERIERDDWIGQAIILAAGGATGYARLEDRHEPDIDDPEFH